MQWLSWHGADHLAVYHSFNVSVLCKIYIYISCVEYEEYEQYKHDNQEYDYEQYK